MEVYLDNASTTKPCSEVLDAMQTANEYYGNPSSKHNLGLEAKTLIDNARKHIAEHINAKPHEVIFTSSGTEANNLSIIGYAEANRHLGGHIITSRIEHISVLNCLRYLYNLGYNMTYIDVDSDGIIDLKQLEVAIRRDTILISIMTANNEIGTLQPIQEIGEIAKYYNIPFHTDAVAAIGHCEIDVEKTNIAMMPISGHKIYGPKGVGALYARDDIELSPLIYGAGQEYGLRSGTENISGIVGLGKAVELLSNPEKETDRKKMLTLKNMLIDEIKNKIPDVKFNGSEKNSLPNIINVSFPGIDSAKLLSALDERGIYASGGSVCSANCMKPFYVVCALGVDAHLARGTVRFSLSDYNTENYICYLLEILPDIVENLK